MLHAKAKHNRTSTVKRHGRSTIKIKEDAPRLESDQYAMTKSNSKAANILELIMSKLKISGIFNLNYKKLENILAFPLKFSKYGHRLFIYPMDSPFKTEES